MIIKPLLLILFLLTALDARENPFFPVDSSEEISVTTNQINTIPPLKRASIELPSTARVLESVTIRYKNLDGSIATKSVEIKEGVDWHLPLFISQSYCSNDSKTTKSQVKTLKVKQEKALEVLNLDFIRFVVTGNQIKIITKDKLLRDFLLIKPHRIVCDFKRDIDIRSYITKLPKGLVFKRIRIGAHKGYYRVVVELDGYYTYRLKKENSAYIFTLH